MTKKELIELVKKIKNCEGSEEEIDDMIDILEKNIIYPDISNLIFYDEKRQKKLLILH